MSQGSAGAARPRESHSVFICYRREETAAHAGRLYDAMVARFGERNVFMDVDLEPGVDFVTRIAEVVAACHVLIVVMGPNWATAKDEEGGLRIADPEDFVRLEVGTGLSCPTVTPIPLLVAGARMPRREDLPEEVQPLTRRNALELSEARWSYDVGRLISTLDGLLPDANGTSEPIATPSRPAPPSGRLALEGALVTGAAAFAARWLWSGNTDSTDTASEIASVMLRRAEAWALAGAALAVWLALRTGRASPWRLGTIGLLVGAIGGALGGATWALPVFLLSEELSAEAMKLLEVPALAVTGGFVGALIGALWHPPRLAAGLASGVLGGASIQLILNSTLERSSDFRVALSFGLGGAAIAGLTLAAMLALDHKRSASRSAPSMGTADP